MISLRVNASSILVLGVENVYHHHKKRSKGIPKVQLFHNVFTLHLYFFCFVHNILYETVDV